MDKKQTILKNARDIFYEKGFKNTNISDITKKAGIAVGTFYTYYDSKEQIFFEIIMNENEIQKKNMLDSIQNDEDPLELVTELVTQNLKAMNENPILKEWNNKELASRLEQHFYENGGIENISDFYHNTAVTLIKKWKSQGRIRKDLDDDLILAMLNSVHYVDIHKRDIGHKFFPQLIRYLVSFIMKGLIE